MTRHDDSRSFKAMIRTGAMTFILAMSLTANPKVEAAVSLEYPIDQLNGSTALPATPSINLLDAGTLQLGGGGTAIAFGTGNIQTFGISQEFTTLNNLNTSLTTYKFSLNNNSNLNIDYSGASLHFEAAIPIGDPLGPSPNMAVFYENALNGFTLVGNSEIPGGYGIFSVDLSSIPTQSTAHSIHLVTWSEGLGIPAEAGILSSAPANNLRIEGAAISPVPEPHEYALIAGMGLVGFAVWRRRSQASSQTESNTATI